MVQELTTGQAQTEIQLDGKKQYLGCFDTVLEAAVAYARAAAGAENGGGGEEEEAREAQPEEEMHESEERAEEELRGGGGALVEGERRAARY